MWRLLAATGAPHSPGIPARQEHAVSVSFSLSLFRSVDVTVARRRLAAACAALILTPWPLTLQAADRNADFTAALRKRGWDDTAVEYLDWVEKSPLITPEFRKQSPYQRALSLASQARKTRNAVQREQLLVQAAADFQAFAKGDPSSPAALDSLRQSANLYGEQALATLAAANQLPEQAIAQREQARTKARASFGQASSVAEQIVALCTKELAALPKATVIQADAEAKARRDQLRDRQVEARFLLARLSFEEAAAYDEKSKEHADALDAASKRFGQLYEEYRDSLVGASSRFYQGRCAQNLGGFEKALGCYEDVVRGPTANPEFRRWAARAHRRRAECFVELGKLDDAISACEDWLATSRPAERQQPEWLEVAYRLAGAYQAKLKDSAGGNDAKGLQSEARNLLRDVSQHPNEFQQEARVALAALGHRTQSGAELKTFEEAFGAGKEAVDVMNSSKLAAKLARDNKPEAVAELQQQADENRREALRVLEVAIDLADRQTPVDQLNTARYYLCVLYLEEKQTFEAAVLAEFLASRYPESEFAASAASVALNAYEQLAIEARAAAKSDAGSAATAGAYESGKMAELAELVASRWPQSTEASTAVNVLIQTALRENRLADAESLLARLPTESRSAAELSLGAGLWTQYLRTTAGQRDALSEEAVALRDKAGDLLTRGFAGLRKSGNPTASAAVGALYLVQYLLAKGDAKSALDVLKDDTAGPLSLVQSKAEAAVRPEFVQETYKAALRAYLSTAPPQRKQADAMMKALDQFVSKQGGDKAAQQLTDVYLGLGVQLQRQMKELTAAGQEDKAKQVAAAFGDVLDRVAKRPDADSWRIRNWLAQTNLQLGQGLSGNEAKAYLNRAKTSYEAILAAAAKDKKYAPDAAALLGVRIRLGECLAALGQHKEAVDQYGLLLREKPNMLDLQQAAAAALQQWGVAKRDAGALDRSIRGDLPAKDGKNLIWGWLRLATMADAAKRQAAAAGASNSDAQQRAARFEDLFFEARYNVARARYVAGTISPPAARQEQFQAAKANVEQMARLYPDLGGPKWKAAFDNLLKQINQELAKK
jgi:tetratricopeptide (TPR) repeat protein